MNHKIWVQTLDIFSKLTLKWIWHVLNFKLMGEYLHCEHSEWPMKFITFSYNSTFFNKKILRGHFWLLFGTNRSRIIRNVHFYILHCSKYNWYIYCNTNHDVTHMHPMFYGNKSMALLTKREKNITLALLSKASVYIIWCWLQNDKFLWKEHFIHGY